jgi:uncharacterized protein
MIVPSRPSDGTTGMRYRTGAVSNQDGTLYHSLPLTRRGGQTVFENQSEVLGKLLTADQSFRRIYERHQQLKAQVEDANHGVSPVEHFELERLKKEKLLLKDQMAARIDAFQRSPN